MIGTEPGWSHWAQLRWLRTLPLKLGRVNLPNHTPFGVSAIRAIASALAR